MNLTKFESNDLCIVMLDVQLKKTAGRRKYYDKFPWTLARIKLDLNWSKIVEQTMPNIFFFSCPLQRAADVSVALLTKPVFLRLERFARFRRGPFRCARATDKNLIITHCAVISGLPFFFFHDGHGWNRIEYKQVTNFVGLVNDEIND